MKRTVTTTLDEDEFRELWMVASYRHIGGQNPVSAALKMLAFDQMRRYPVPDAQRAEFERKYAEAFPGPKAVQQ